MRKGSKWVALLALLAMLLTFLLAGPLSASAQEFAAEEAKEGDGVVTLEEAPTYGSLDELLENMSSIANDVLIGILNTILQLGIGIAQTIFDFATQGNCGSFEALVWDDTANPDGALNEGEIYVDGLEVKLSYKDKDGKWVPYGTKMTGAEPKDFVRWVPWWNPIHEHGWVGWNGLPTNLTGIERLPAGDGVSFNEYWYTDYKMELIPSGIWKPSNDTVRYARLYKIQFSPFQWAPAIWCYPQNGDPAVRGFGVWEPSTISGNVFEDSNANGAKGRYESNLKGWTVILTVDLKEVARTTTDAYGNYQFTGLKCGFYQVWMAERCFWKCIFYYHPPIVPRPSGVYRGNHFVWIKPHEKYAGRNFGMLNMLTLTGPFNYGKYCLALVAYWLGLGYTNPNAYLD